MNTGNNVMFLTGMNDVSFTMNGRIGTLNSEVVDGFVWIKWDDRNNENDDDGHSYVKVDCIKEIDPIWQMIYILTKSIIRIEDALKDNNML